jgi:hypothetical protein
MSPAFSRGVLASFREQLESHGIQRILVVDVVSQLALLTQGEIDFAGFPRDTVDLVGVVVSSLILGVDGAVLEAYATPYLQRLAQDGDEKTLSNVSNYLLKPLAIHPITSGDAELRRRIVGTFHRLHRIANDNLYLVASRAKGYGAIRNRLLAVFAKTEYPKSSVIHFTFLTAEYIENLYTWLRAFVHARVQGHLVILLIGEGLTAPVEQAIAVAGLGELTSIIQFQSEQQLSVCGNGLNLNFLWYVKILAISHLVSCGNRVIYSDLDSYWLRDAKTFDASLSDGSAECIFMQTGDLPMHGVWKWGFVPCAGFFAINSGEFAQRFLNKWLAMTEVMFDDQIGLFELLDDFSGRWEPSEHGAIEYRYATEALWMDGRVAVLKRSVAARSAAVAVEQALQELKSMPDCVVWHPRWAAAGAVHEDVLAVVRKAYEG